MHTGSPPHLVSGSAPELAPAIGVPRWDTEVFLVSGADRADLRRRVQALRDYVAGDPACCLKDLAFTLAREAGHGGSRLAVVAGSAEQLVRLLQRAAERLADAGVSELRDAAGIYYSDRPLAREGRVAFLFPGEGAQYLGMAGDLCRRFPDLAALLRECETRESESGRRAEGLGRFILPPVDLSPADRASLEEELRQLDNAMHSVLLADWLLLRLLEGLKLRPDAVGGHSAGELAALWYSGCLSTDFDLPGVADTMRTLERQEEEQSLGGAVLLAVGGSRAAVAEVLDAAAAQGPSPAGGPQAFLAMDNCPHQTVVVGTAEAMTAVEGALRDRKLIYERLPLRRAYHTRLFEPFMGPLVDLFSDALFRPPRTTVYSCTTARPFPDDPEEIRRLALAHWASPVEFSRMIEQMHADGIRVFVEVGPRGNLTSFVEDILQGRRFLAAPANVVRRSGIAQLNHLVGMLAAHHVPLDLEYLYRHRGPQAVPWQGAPVPAPAGPPLRTGGAAAVTSYFDLMERFAHTQRAVMEAFLQCPRNPGKGAAAVLAGDASARLSALRDEKRDGPHGKEGDDRGPAVPHWPLVGRIVRHNPGRELVVQRRLDLDEDRFAAEHTVGGRSISGIDPDQHGLPVMPMTYNLEMMAEVAGLLVPGKLVIGLEKVQLMRWLAYDEAEPSLIEVVGRVAKDSRPTAEVAARVTVEVRKMAEPGGPAANAGLAAVGTVLMADRYPDMPPADGSPLSGAGPCSISLKYLYDSLMHGPLLQGVTALEGMNNEGIDARVTTLARDRLFRSVSDPRFHLDPTLADVIMHPLAGWHLAQPDQSGRIMLPYELDSLRLYMPSPAVGTELRVRGRIEECTARRAVHAIEAVAPDGRVWCRLRGRYWRFYLPWGRYNFHGPKDLYFLSRDWPEALPERLRGQTSQAAPAASPAPHAWCMRLDVPPDLRQANMQLAGARVTLSPTEMRQFRQLTGQDAERARWLFDRFVAKDAVRTLWREHCGERLFIADVEIEADRFGRLAARIRGRDDAQGFPHVSVSQLDGVLAGVAAFTPFLGIELRTMARSAQDDDREEWRLRFEAAGSAAAKALSLGRRVDPGQVAARCADRATGEIDVELDPALAAGWNESRDVRLRVYTARDRELVVAVALGEEADP